jgi:hypothetical protein
MAHMDTYIYITSALLLFFSSFLLHFFSFSWQAGWPRPLFPLTLASCALISHIGVLLVLLLADVVFFGHSHLVLSSRKFSTAGWLAQTLPV